MWGIRAHCALACSALAFPLFPSLSVRPLGVLSFVCARSLSDGRGARPRAGSARVIGRVSPLRWV
jgi:hypothetical protein